VRTLNRILLVSDRSASTDSAVLYAAALARQAQTSILAMQVVETAVTAFPRWTDIFRSSEIIAAKEAEGRAALERLAAHPALSELDVHYLLDHGHPADRITDMAPQVDLIVMGTGDASSADGHAAQRTAKEVAHGSVTPVLLVPPGGGTAGTPSPEATQLPWQRLLLAIDMRGYAPQAIHMATSLASTQHASLIVLHVLNPQKLSAYPVSAGEGMHHSLQGLKILLAKRLAEVLPDASEGPPYLREVVEGEAAPVIIAQAAAHQADLIIVSAHPYGTIQKLFIPSTVDALLEEIACPILAVPFPRSTLRSQAALV
jgi:nucleotide-binding universal stress UspA family protein